MIFQSWMNERYVRLWESFRMLGYEQVYAHQYDQALRFFRRSSEMSRKLGKENYHYAISLEDVAVVLANQGEFSKARILIEKAIAIFQKEKTKNHKLESSINEDEILANCRLCELTLKSGKNARTAWDSFSTPLTAFSKLKLKNVDPVVSRTVCQTIMSIGEGAIASGDTELAQSAFVKANEISDQLASNRGWTKELVPQKKTVFLDGKSINKLIDKSEQELRQGDVHGAEQTLADAQKAAKTANAPELGLEVLIQKSRLMMHQGNYEEAEKICLDLLKNKNLDLQKQDNNLTKLTIIYRQSGYKEDVAAVLKRQLAIRKQIYGPKDGNTVEIQVDYAKTLQQLGKYEEAKLVCRGLTKLLQEGLNADLSKASVAEKFACVIVRIGDTKLGKDLLAPVMGLYPDNIGKQKLWVALAFFDLTALESIEGRSIQAQETSEQGNLLTHELNHNERVVFPEPLRDWAFFLKNKAEAKLFIKTALLTMPLPIDRKEALREIAYIADFESLKSKHPAAFSSDVIAHVREVKAAAAKFASIKLQGLKNVP